MLSECHLIIIIIINPAKLDDINFGRPLCLFVHQLLLGYLRNLAETSHNSLLGLQEYLWVLGASFII